MLKDAIAVAIGGLSGHAVLHRTCLLLTQSGHSHRGSNRSSVTALPELAGAFSTLAHAGGKSLSLSPLADGEGEASGILKRRIQSTNQWESDLSHPFPAGTEG